jgi:hypothetical protein
MSIEGMIPMKMVWAKHESVDVFEMKCLQCGLTWKLPKGFDYGSSN